ncbi:MAG TPA: hypothetical protein VGI93_11000 [Steroidobacteraceae bacterium]|jgi:hypothetical protein
MADFEQLTKSYEVGDQLDEIASADPPAYLRRTFAEGISSPRLNWKRIQQLAVCAMVLDAIVDDRDYEVLERELISDWRVHYLAQCRKLKELAAQALHRVLEEFKPDDPESLSELSLLHERLAGTA